MRSPLIVFVLLLALPTAFAATCGDNNAQGGEQCDGADLRGYSCTNLCHLRASNPADYTSQSTASTDADRFYCYDGGELRCGADCKMDGSGCYENLCGDGRVTGAEECDDGSQNSDSQPNGCRTECVLPRCGDNVVDAGEQCDDGPRNSDAIPDACRSDCTFSSCGDGVIDVDQGEECDDDFGDCFKCKRCVEPRDNLVISEDVTLCPGNYQLEDTGAEGVLIISGSGVTVQCRDVYLYGVPTQIGQFAQGVAASPAALAAMQQGAQGGNDAGSAVPARRGLFSRMFGFVKRVFTSDAEDAMPPPRPLNLGMAVSEIKRGTGIMITGDENVLVGCDVSNYRTGIEVTGERNVLARNRVCGNNQDILGLGVGGSNACASGSWNDAGHAGCAYRCDGSPGNPADDPCQPRPCQPGEEPLPRYEPDPVPTPENVSEEPVECPDGSQALTVADCPAEDCPQGEFMCDDGTCVAAAWRCDPYACWDGSVAPEEEECPSRCDDDEHECENGKCVDEAWECAPYLCPGGVKAPSRSACPDEGCSLEEPILCDDDETCVADEDDCPDDCPFTCPDGSCVDSMDACGPCPGLYECADGSCAANGDACIICCRTQLPTPVAVLYEYNLVATGDCGGVVVEGSFCG